MDYKQKYLKYKNKYFKLKQFAGAALTARRLLQRPPEQITHKVLKGHNDIVTSVGFSKDGTKIVSGSHDHSIRVWNAETGQLEKTLNGHVHNVKSVGFNHNGTKIVSGSSDLSIRVWNAKTGQLKKTWVAHDNDIYSVGFNHDDGPLIAVAGSGDKEISVWYVNNTHNKIAAMLRQHTDAVFSVAFNNGKDDQNPGTKIVSGSRDGEVHISNVVRIYGKSQPISKGIPPMKGHTGHVFSVGFNHDGTKIVSGSSDKTIRVWNADTGQLEKILNGHTGGVTSVGFNHNGTKIVSGSDDKTILVWDVLSSDPDTDVSMVDCKNDVDGLLFEPWKQEDYRQTVFLKFTMQNGSKETWCLTEKFYPADPKVPGDTDQTVSRDNYVDNMLFANWVEKSDGSPYTVDQRMGREGQPGRDRYVRITSIFNGYARYILFDDVLRRVITIKQGDGRTRDNSNIGFNDDSHYPMILHLEYAKHVAIGNIRGEMGRSDSHGNVSDDVYRVTRIEEKTIHK